jgi:hypothetical protein
MEVIAVKEAGIELEKGSQGISCYRWNAYSRTRAVAAPIKKEKINFIC